MDKSKIQLTPGAIRFAQLHQVVTHPVRVELEPEAYRDIENAYQTIQSIIQQGKTVYGVNTGFGLLAQERIGNDELNELQTNLVLSHSAGIGEPLPKEVVRLVLFLKVASLARGYSGVSVSVIEMLLSFLEHDVLPVIPCKGSVGASGDLAPLAHMSAAMMGIGDVYFAGQRLTAKEVLSSLNLQPLVLGPKEGLALLNGTQVSTALAMVALFKTEDLFAAAVVSGALSVDAMKGTDVPFDPRIHQLRGQRGQQQVAQHYLNLLNGSDIRASHYDCDHIQDPYSLRCQPQVMGSCLDVLQNAAKVLIREANAVTDNPLVFSDSGEVLSGGNFHAEPIAMVADKLALAIAEIGALAERRLALLIDPHMSGLPAFLIEHSGLNSGFMIAQVTAASLASENKVLAHPACVDSLPTSANQEDHVSMATFAARRLHEMIDNANGIVAIELLAAAQGVEFHKPHATSKPLQTVIDRIRQQVPFYDKDRYISPDINMSIDIIKSGFYRDYVLGLLPTLKE